MAEDTVYTFALLLAVYLVGSAAGAAAYQRWGRVWPRDRLLFALAAACLLGTGSLWSAEQLKAAGVGEELIRLFVEHEVIGARLERH